VPEGAFHLLNRFRESSNHNRIFTLDASLPLRAKPLEVPRSRVNATILLPVGSSPGSYEVRILDGDLGLRASAKGSAEIRNYVTTLEAPRDSAQGGRPGVICSTGWS
jgi:hypothetical protein